MARLHFVYNVEATPLALISDFVHRLRSPATYPCRLCDVTYGRFLKKAEWSEYLEGLPIPSKFHLRSGFRQRYPERAQDPLPSVYLGEAGHLDPLISKSELDRVHDLPGLRALLEEKLHERGLLSRSAGAAAPAHPGAE